MICGERTIQYLKGSVLEKDLKLQCVLSCYELMRLWQCKPCPVIHTLASGLWPLASGLWPLASGLWPLASGLWPLASGLWPLASGLWPPASGLRPLASGLWPPAFWHLKTLNFVIQPLAFIKTFVWSIKTVGSIFFNKCMTRVKVFAIVKYPGAYFATVKFTIVKRLMTQIPGMQLRLH
jgi:hypothetical protein